MPSPLIHPMVPSRRDFTGPPTRNSSNSQYSLFHLSERP